MTNARIALGVIAAAIIAIAATALVGRAPAQLRAIVSSPFRRVGTYLAYSVVGDRHRYVGLDLGSGHLLVLDTARGTLNRFAIAADCSVWIANGAANGQYGAGPTIPDGEPASSYAAAICGGRRWVAVSLADGHVTRIPLAIKRNYIPFSIGRFWLDYGICHVTGPLPIICYRKYLNWHTGIQRALDHGYANLDDRGLSRERAYPFTEPNGRLFVRLASGARVRVSECDPTCDQVGLVAGLLSWRQGSLAIGYEFGGAYFLGSGRRITYRFASRYAYGINVLSTPYAFVVSKVLQTASRRSECVFPVELAQGLCRDRYALMSRTW